MPDTRRNLNARLDEKQDKIIQEQVMMGLPDGSTVEVSGEDYMIWVTGWDGKPEKVLNLRRPNTWGKFVNVGYDPNDLPTRKQVLGFADIYKDAGSLGPALVSHHVTHYWGGVDALYIQREQILKWVPVANENKVDYYPNPKNTPAGWWGSTSMIRIDYSAHIPATGVRVCIVVVDSSKNVTFRDSSIFDTKSLIAVTDWPALTAGDTVLFGLWLFAGMEQCYHEPGNDNFIDLSESGAYGGGTSTGSGLNQLTGDVTAGPGTGSQVATLATVNANVGAFEQADITLDAKGRVLAGKHGNTFATQVVADGITTLTAMSANNQVFTSAGPGVTETVKMPVVSTLYLGKTYWLINQCPEWIYVQSSGGDRIADLAPNQGLAKLVCAKITGTDETSWVFAQNYYDIRHDDTLDIDTGDIKHITAALLTDLGELTGGGDTTLHSHAGSGGADGRQVLSFISLGF
jgi:hypothetical protein